MHVREENLILWILLISLILLILVMLLILLILFIYLYFNKNDHLGGKWKSAFQLFFLDLWTLIFWLMFMMYFRNVQARYLARKLRKTEKREKHANCTKLNGGTECKWLLNYYGIMSCVCSLGTFDGRRIVVSADSSNKTNLSITITFLCWKLRACDPRN